MMQASDFKKSIARRLGLIATTVALLMTTVHASAQQGPNPSVETCLEDHVAGQESKLDGHLLEARKRLQKCAQSTCPGPVAHECQQLVSEVELHIASILPTVRDSEGRDVVEGSLAIDGEVIPLGAWGRPREVDPGAHELTLTRDQRIVARMKILVVESEKNRRVDVRVEGIQEKPTPSVTSGLRIAGVIGASVGGAALIGGGVLAGLTRAEYGDLQASCAPRCTEDVVSGVRQKALAADMLFGTGIVLGVTGVLIAVLPRKNAGSAPVRADWVPVVLPMERGFVAGIVGQWF